MATETTAQLPCVLCAREHGEPSVVLVQSTGFREKQPFLLSAAFRGAVCSECEVRLRRAWNLSRLGMLAAIPLWLGALVALLATLNMLGVVGTPGRSLGDATEIIIALLCLAWFLGTVLVCIKAGDWSYQRATRFLPEPRQRQLATLARRAGVNHSSQDYLGFYMRVLARREHALPRGKAHSVLGRLEIGDSQLTVVPDRRHLQGTGPGVLGSGLGGNAFGCTAAVVFVVAVAALALAGVPHGAPIAVSAVLVAVGATIAIGRLKYPAKA
jgi:hypothetical protein